MKKKTFQGWTEVEMYCYKNAKYPNMSIRKEMVKQCFFTDGKHFTF